VPQKCSHFASKGYNRGTLVLRRLLRDQTGSCAVAVMAAHKLEIINGGGYKRCEVEPGAGEEAVEQAGAGPHRLSRVTFNASAVRRAVAPRVRGESRGSG
jgi:hypothetical protein